MKQRARRRRRRYGKWVWEGLAVVGMITLATIALRWSSAPPIIPGSPRLVVDRERIDLGERRFSAPASAAFTLTNTGTGSLRIVENPRVLVAKGCCAPAAIVGRTIIQPGESTTLSMLFTMHDGMGGPYEFVVPLRTNDPERPERTLTVASYWGIRRR